MGFGCRLIFLILMGIPQFLGALPPEIYSPDYYRRIGVHTNADYEEILLEAEKLMGEQRHAISKFGAKADGYWNLREAYLTLSDPLKRAAYDLKNKVETKYGGTAPDNWKVRVQDFCAKNDPLQTYEVVLEPSRASESLTDKAPRTPSAETHQRPSELIDQIEDGRVSSAKFGRTAVLIRHELYLNFLEEAKSNLFIEGRRPRVLDEVFRAHLAQAQAHTFPGILLGALALPVGTLGVIVGPSLAAIEVGWKWYESQKRSPRAYRHLMSHLRDVRYGSLSSADRPEYSKLANNLILVDLWIEVLLPEVLIRTKSRELSDPAVNYSVNYEERFPLWQITHRLIKLYPDLAPALLFRFLQERPNALFLEGITRENPRYWFSVAERLKPALNEQKQGELEAEFEALRHFIKRLSQSPQGRVARATRWALNTPQLCQSYLAHVFRVSRSMIKRPDGYR